MLNRTVTIIALLLGLLLPQAAWAKLTVVCTNSSYAPIAEYIGGDFVEVNYLVQGYQDPHIVRPKPSLAVKLQQADLFIATGLDLEMWAPALVDQSNNPTLRSGQNGYVAVSTGIEIQETPKSLSRAEGDVHIFGNPHIHTSPLNGKVIAQNITVGLKRVDPDNAATYDANLERFEDEISNRLYGGELVGILGAKTLDKLAYSGRLYEFLEAQQYKGQFLSAYLGGWMKQAEPLRGKKLVTFHKNWGYFVNLFGLQVVEYMEPKPGIPPSPGHITDVIQTMSEQDIHVMMAANYFDVAKVKVVAEKTEAVPFIVALGVYGQDDINSFFDQFDVWIGGLLQAYQQAGQL